MAEEDRSETEASHEADETRDDPKSGHSSNKSGYRQKYKHAWELDTELGDWLTACNSDAYAAFCKFCRTKLHAHKKGLLAHAKSAKHKKHVAKPNLYGDDAMMPSDSLNTDNGQSNGALNGGFDDSFIRGPKRNYKGQRLFQDSWLKEPLFSCWLRKVPSNSTKALCVACRCIIAAGRSELVKHTRAAKHKKAVNEGPFQEVCETDLHWLEIPGHDQSELSINPVAMIPSNQLAHYRPIVVDLPGLLLDDVIERLNKHVPLELAEGWDNVGIITKPTQQVKIFNVLLTIDLNERVVEEAIKKGVQFIICYHPIIFKPIKSLKPSAWKDMALLMCVENKITVYTPHTALDAVKGGINDWLISTFLTSEEATVRPVIHSVDKSNSFCLEALLSEPQETVTQIFKNMNNVTLTEYGNSSTDVRVACDIRTLPEVIEQLSGSNCTQVYSRVTQLVPPPLPGIGMGRIVTLATQLPLYEVVQRIKSHLDLAYLRLALSPKHTRDTKVGSIAVCAGSGSSVLNGCEADVWITGEMSHHEVLDATNNGITIVLCEHTNTERGFLKNWSQQLRNSVFDDQVQVVVSEMDREPLRIV